MKIGLTTVVLLAGMSSAQADWRDAEATGIKACLQRGDMICAAQVRALIYDMSHGQAGAPGPAGIFNVPTPSAQPSYQQPEVTCETRRVPSSIYPIETVCR